MLILVLEREKKSQNSVSECRNEGMMNLEIGHEENAYKHSGRRNSVFCHWLRSYLHRSP